MSIDIANEEVVTLNKATEYVPKRGRPKKVHVSTIYRWALPGIRGVRLETIMVGGTRCTSVEALLRFFERLTAATDGKPVPSSDSRHRQAQVRAAERELEAAGI